MIRITNLYAPLEYDMEMLIASAAQKLHLECSQIRELKIVKRSLHENESSDLIYKFTLDVITEDKTDVILHHKDKDISIAEELKYDMKDAVLVNRPVVIGSGPAGLFASLILAESGTDPILLERGLDVDSRIKSIERFISSGELDTTSNVQFGEGGAGTFSDGKLKTGKIDPRKFKILSEFVEAGAPSEILYLDKPHLGTDNLKLIVKNMRRKIISLGADVRFSSKVTQLIVENGSVKGVVVCKDDDEYKIYSENIILAIGHSARDTFTQLHSQGVLMESKGFGVGIRIEHPQSYINKIIYGKSASHPSLGAADYKLVTHLDNGRSVYTFCMCPGGTVIPATSEIGSVVTNGMSLYDRNGKNANTALLVSVSKEDFPDSHPLAGMHYQQQLESLAFNTGGGGYKAPVQRLEDFMQNRMSTGFGDVYPTYRPGTSFALHDSYLPEFITSSLRKAVTDMDEWMNGFYYPDALMTGVETRSTSPVRMIRNENLEASGIRGLYPCGEGAGYAGGIISSAVDGILCAEQILKDKGLPG
ncbi:MAG: hypothetical protein WCY62_04600 [Clostridia bacterium]